MERKLDEVEKWKIILIEEYHTYCVGYQKILVHNAGADYNQSPKEIIAERTKDLDTQEHPSKYYEIL